MQALIYCTMAIKDFMNINFHEKYSCSPFMNIKFYTIFILFICITILATICNAQLYLCNCRNYQTDVAFGVNLETVLNMLVQNSRQQTGFNTYEYGESPNLIYGLLQCRGDATDAQCHNCALKAKTNLPKFCWNKHCARIWSEFCYLRYENYSFVGRLDTSGWIYNLSDYTVSSPNVFNATLVDLLTNLSAKATPMSSRNRYAVGTTNASFSPKIYALIQCIGETSADNCTTCISEAINEIFTTYPGYEGVQVVWGSCIVIYEPNPFYDLPQPPAEAPANTPVVTPSTANTPVITPSSNSKHSNKIPTILGIVGGLLLALLVCLFTTRRIWKYAIFRRGYEVREQVEEDTQMVSEDRQVVTFKMETLVAATENFHDKNKLGQGGFGCVYKGTTHDGKEIAVKKLSLNSVQGKKEFMNEVQLVAKIQHRNLVKLLGCCAEGSERLLIYEFLANNSLDKILFDPIKCKLLDWQKRYNIIMGIARGLLYLHQDSQPRIIHRDIKASNILLDDKLNPKIADFGLAKLFPEDESYVNTRVAGTFGYMAPEYAMQGQLTVKADVYSFGVLLLELVTGRRNMDYTLSPETQILLGWAWRSYKEGNIVQMIDPVALIETSDGEQASRCIHVGLLCTQAEASLRPPMSTATLMLSSVSLELPDPTKPVVISSFNRNTRSSSSINQNTRSNSSSFGLSYSFAPLSLDQVSQ